MPAPFASCIGMLRRNDHKYGRCNPGNGGQAADEKIIHAGESFHDLRQPEGNAVEAHHDRKVNSGERPNAPTVPGSSTTRHAQQWAEAASGRSPEFTLRS